MQTVSEDASQRDRDGKICARHLAGESCDDIGRSLGLSEEIVRAIVIAAKPGEQVREKLRKLRNAFLCRR